MADDICELNYSAIPLDSSVSSSFWNSIPFFLLGTLGLVIIIIFGYITFGFWNKKSKIQKCDWCDNEFTLTKEDFKLPSYAITCCPECKEIVKKIYKKYKKN